MKRLLFFFLLIITGFAYGQNPCPCQSLRLSLFTGSDPTPQDGWIWYRSDTDKLRLRANGVTDNVATEGYVFGNFLPLLLTGDTDVNGLGTLRIGNPDLVEDAITGTWLEIFNDGFFGDYVSIVDQDATLMTSLGSVMQFPAGINSVPGNSSFTVSSSIIGFESTDNGLKIPTLLSDNVTVPTAGKILQEGISMEHYDGSKWRQIVSYGEDDFIIQPSRLYYSAVTDFSGFADSVLVHKKYVDDLFSSGAFWPLTGTADATGDISIDGNDFDLNLGSTNGFDLIRLNTTSGIEKTLVQSSGFKVSTKQFSATILDNTAGQQNVVHTIDVSSPAVAYYNLRITSALAVNTANGRIISCNPFTAIAEMDTGTLSGTSATPVNVYHGGPTTGGFNVNFNDTNDEIEIRFLNETGTGFQWSISVEYELMIAE